MNLQDLYQKVQRPMKIPLGNPNGKLDLKFWLLIAFFAGNFAFWVKAVPGLDARVQKNERKLAVLESKMEILPDIVAAKVVDRLGRRGRNTR